MFALIDTKDASEIAIYIPSDDNCSESLKQLTLMLEHNATFYKNKYQSFEIVNPQMSVTLGDKHEFSSGYESMEVTVASNDHVLDPHFSIDTAQVKASYAKAQSAFTQKNQRLQKEIASLKFEIEQLKEKLEETNDD